MADQSKTTQPPVLHGDGINNDAPALKAIMRGKPVKQGEQGSLLADMAAIRAAVAKMGGLGWESLDQFKREMRDE